MNLKEMRNSASQGQQLPVETSTSLVNTNINQLAKLCQDDVDITQALSGNTIDNMKAFLVAYSRSQLTRVIKLTDTIGKLEDNLIDQSLGNPQMDPEILMKIIKTIQSSLSSALDLIKQVTSDESFIKVIISNTEVVNNEFNQYNISGSVLKLPNQDSRDKVRSIVNQIIEKTKELDGSSPAVAKTIDAEVVDVEEVNNNVEDMEEIKEDSET